MGRSRSTSSGSFPDRASRLPPACRENPLETRNWRYLIPIGFIGRVYDVFPHLNSKLFQSLRDGELLFAFLNVFLSVVVGFLSVWLGVIAGADARLSREMTIRFRMQLKGLDSATLAFKRARTRI